MARCTWWKTVPMEVHRNSSFKSRSRERTKRELWHAKWGVIILSQATRRAAVTHNPSPCLIPFLFARRGSHPRNLVYPKTSLRCTHAILPPFPPSLQCICSHRANTYITPHSRCTHRPVLTPPGPSENPTAYTLHPPPSFCVAKTLDEPGHSQPRCGLWAQRGEFISLGRCLTFGPFHAHQTFLLIRHATSPRECPSHRRNFIILSVASFIVLHPLPLIWLYLIASSVKRLSGYYRE